MRKELEWIEIPDEHEARQRAWKVVSAAFAEREPTSRRRSWRTPVLVAAAMAVIAAALSPPGMAVLGEVRDAVLPTRIQRAQPVVTLPAPGRLLVVSAERGGVWIVNEDGSRRRLGAFEDASWSPFGRYVVATTRDRLITLDRRGRERWSLTRARPSWPRWGGTRTDTWIAYVVRSQLRVVAGDGTGDRMLAERVSSPPAWRPGRAQVLAYVQADRLRVVDVNRRREVWSRRLVQPASALHWSAGGRRLAALSQTAVSVYDGASGRLVRRIDFAPPAFPRGKSVGLPISAAFAPSGHDLALVLRDTRSSFRSRIVLVRGAAARGPIGLFAGAGEISDLAWSPNGNWLLADWRGADQWIFLRMRERVAGVARVLAASGIEAQFPRPDGKGPLLWLAERWRVGP